MIANLTNVERMNEPTSVSSQQSTVSSAANRNQRREKEQFGKHPLWRRVSGITFVAESAVSPKERRKGLRRLVRWMEARAGGTARRGDGGTGRRGETDAGS